MKACKISFLIGRIGMGGAETVTLALANYFCKKNGWEVHLISMYPPDKNWIDLIDSKIHQHFLFMDQKGIQIIRYFKKIYKIRQLSKEIQSELMVSLLTMNNIAAIVAMHKLKTKLIIGERGNPLKKSYFVIEVLKHLLYRFADGMIAQTTISKEFYAKHFKCKNIEVIPNPIKDDYYISKRPDLKNGRTIISTGRLIPSKNQVKLIEYFAAANSNNEWELHIFGNGPEKENILHKIDQLGLNDKVKLIENVSNLSEFLSQASIFAFTSLSEGFPNSLAEAVASGLPCICFDCMTGPSELVQNNFNGFLVPVGKDEEYIDGLRQLMNNKKIRLDFGANAAIVADRFKSAIILERFSSFFESFI